MSTNRYCGPWVFPISKPGMVLGTPDKYSEKRQVIYAHTSPSRMKHINPQSLKVWAEWPPSKGCGIKSRGNEQVYCRETSQTLAQTGIKDDIISDESWEYILNMIWMKTQFTTMFFPKSYHPILIWGQKSERFKLSSLQNTQPILRRLSMLIKNKENLRNL